MDVIPIGIQNQNSQSRIGRIDPYKRNAPQRNACRIPRPRQGSHPLAGGRAKRTPPETIPRVFPTPNGVASTPAPNTPYTSSTQRETVPRPRTGVAPISRRSSEANTSGNDPPRISDPERGRIHSSPKHTLHLQHTTRNGSPTPTGVASISRRSSAANTSGNDPPRLFDPERGRIHSSPKHTLHLQHTTRNGSPTPTGVAPISRRSSAANTSGNDPPRISDPERGRVHSSPKHTLHLQHTTRNGSTTPAGVASISRRSSAANTSGNDPPRLSDPERGRIHSSPKHTLHLQHTTRNGSTTPTGVASISRRSSAANTSGKLRSSPG